jgi:uncharacterized protein (DUF1684 family)
MDENEAEILEFRKQKDEFYRSSDPESPLDQEAKAAFKGLKYFPYDSKYRVKARFTPYPNPEQVSMSTSRGIKQVYARVGYFEFTLMGKRLGLQAYRSPHGSHSEGYFVPFRDATSGSESYANARYLDIDEDSNAGDDEYWFDFNLAYNPYCAYTDKFICPFPPEENMLKVPIRAGERRYE